MGFATVGFLSHPHFLLENAVVLALGVLVVVETCHSVRMTIRNQPIHAFFLKSVDGFKRLGFVAESQGICLFVFDCVSLKLELFLWAAS